VYNEVASLEMENDIFIPELEYFRVKRRAYLFKNTYYVIF
jgi:hypothetical protein